MCNVYSTHTVQCTVSTIHPPQVRTVSLSSSPAAPVIKTKKFSEGSNLSNLSSTLPTSPSKIKNMAALFEQKH